MDAPGHKYGVVYLVGGGPGDPELLTLKAARLLAAADVVAYDDLLNPALLGLCKATAELIPVGYRGLRQGQRPGASSGSEAVLPPFLLEKARQGQMVVRLKCGDPLVFGRGGEEALELRAAGIAFEIVPGITAALGAAAYAGIPLTHRSLAASVTLATGHLAAAMPSPSQGLQPHGVEHGTIVLYMPRHELGQHLRQLAAKGVPQETPAAFICAATTPAQQVIVGTIDDLADKVAGFRTGAPGLVVIGRTVSLRSAVHWFEQAGPLVGTRILVARARSGASGIAKSLRALGAEVIEVPLVQEVPLSHLHELDAVIAALDAEACLIFACAGSVHAVMRRLSELACDHRSLPQCRTIAVGLAAAAALRDHGWQPWQVLTGSCDQGTASIHQGIIGARVFMFTSQDGRPQLVASLHRRGISVRTIVSYEARRVFPKIVSPQPDLIVLPSSSAARSVLAADFGASLLHIPMVAIGPITAAAATEVGAQRVKTTAHDDPEAVVAAAVEMLRKGSGGAAAQVKGSLASRRVETARTVLPGAFKPVEWHP